jgi:hypothetical protein
MMTEKIAGLTPEQAQRALLLFYDSLPNEFWEGGRKPSTTEIEAAADNLQDNLTGEMQPAFDALMGKGNEAVKGETVKILLDLYWQHEPLQPYVEQAATKATEPMAPIPIIIGAMIVVLATIPEIEVKKDGKKKQVTIKWNPAAQIGNLVGKFAELLKALPQAMLEKFI